MDWEAVGKDISETVGRYKGQWSKGRPMVKDNAAANDFLRASGGEADKTLDDPRGFRALNRNSALGQTHGVLTRALEQAGMGSTVAGITAGAGMGVAGLGASNAISNLSYNHPTLGAGAGVVGAAGLAAAALDPAMLGSVLRSGTKSISKLKDTGIPGVKGT